MKLSTLGGRPTSFRKAHITEPLGLTRRSRKTPKPAEAITKLPNLKLLGRVVEFVYNISLDSNRG
jgi:hypothetical protein